MADHGWKERLRYRFDNFMARGGSSLFLSLVLLFLAAFLAVGGIRALLWWIHPAGAGEIDGAFRHLWTVFLEMTDAGNMGEDSGASVAYKAVGILAGFSGVIIFSVLIAFLTTSLDRKMGDLKKGRSRVLESGHTLILGWNERVVEILRELVTANESEREACVVVLADRDKEEMDDFLSLHLEERKTTRVVTRTGSTSSLVSLDLVAVGASKSVIVLAGCGESASDDEKSTSDARVIKTVLAVAACRPEGKTLNIVAEVFDARARSVVEEIAPGEVTMIDTRDVLARMLVQTSRSSGLAVVYTEILGFAGNEMYFHHAPWGTLDFAGVQFRYGDGIALGLRRADGTIALNPPADTRLAADDEVILLASDNSAIRFRDAPVAGPADLPLRPGRIEPKVERALLLGWNPKAPAILEQYASYVKEGSSIDVMTREASPEFREALAALQRALPKVKVGRVPGDPMRSEDLANAKPGTYDSVVVLSQGGTAEDPEKIDSETIIILLLLRRILAKDPAAAQRTKLITEVMDSENQELVARAGVNDFIISNRLVSKLFAQVSEQAEIKRVYDDLFREGGSELCLKPASLYLDGLPRDVAFADLMALAQTRGEVCLGWRSRALEHDLDRNFGVTLNPDKTSRMALQPQDSLVVLAENDG